MFKSFNVHYNPGPNKLDSSNLRRGFTAVIEPVLDDPRYVFVYLAFCSKKDQFNKKLGSIKAREHAPIRVHKKQVPKFLLECAKSCTKDGVSWVFSYDFVLKHFI